MRRIKPLQLQKYILSFKKFQRKKFANKCKYFKFNISLVYFDLRFNSFGNQLAKILIDYVVRIREIYIYNFLKIICYLSLRIISNYFQIKIEKNVLNFIPVLIYSF